MTYKIQKVFVVSDIVAFDLVSVKSHYYEENTYHRQSMCSQAVPRFQISLTEIFSNSILLRVIEKHDETSLVQITAVFGTVWYVDCRMMF